MYFFITCMMAHLPSHDTQRVVSVFNFARPFWCFQPPLDRKPDASFLYKLRSSSIEAFKIRSAKILYGFIMLFQAHSKLMLMEYEVPCSPEPGFDWKQQGLQTYLYTLSFMTSLFICCWANAISLHPLLYNTLR